MKVIKNDTFSFTYNGDPITFYAKSIQIPKKFFVANGEGDREKIYKLLLLLCLLNHFTKKNRIQVKVPLTIKPFLEIKSIKLYSIKMQNSYNNFPITYIIIKLEI